MGCRLSGVPAQGGAIGGRRTSEYADRCCCEGACGARYGRSAPGTPAVGRRGDLYRARDGLARYRNRQHCPARHRRRSSRQPGGCGLGGQCLSDRPGCNAVAAGRARRNCRPSAHLSRRPAAVHPGVGRLCLRLVAAEPAGSPRATGFRGQRHHERQHGADPFHLSQPPAWPRIRPERAGGRHRFHAWTDHRLRQSCRSATGPGCSRSICRSA